ncbi:MAG: type I-B CRISPR-associated protein Cas5b [Candidatus Cloacimonetes bacterium]|nr:type I-B CRISPR-associated protein Cas5b [Candidatus Cloacimonadota bacterium]
MKVYRIHITSWTASFRYPNMISGFQPTLTVPPLSTINGLISAAKGDWFCITNEKIGYFFRYGVKTVDLETVYQMGQSNSQIKSNVINREFLSDTELYLYTDSMKIVEYFRNPHYQLLLGRSGDLAQVDEISEVEVNVKEELRNVKGTIIPFRKHKVASPIQALPTHFSNEIPRKNIGTQPYFIVDFKTEVTLKAKGFSDKIYSEKINKTEAIDIYWQEI